MRNFKNLTSTFTPTIFTWSFYSDFAKIEKNTFSVRVVLGILGSLIGETDIEEKFISSFASIQKSEKVLPILLAIRDPIKIILNSETKVIEEVGLLFNSGISLDVNLEDKMRVFSENLDFEKFLQIGKYPISVIMYLVLKLDSIRMPEKTEVEHLWRL